MWVTPVELPYIAELIGEGQMTVGAIRSVGKLVAVTNDGKATLTMLVLRKGEVPMELLIRLHL